MTNINDVVVQGSGVLITFDDGTKKQLMWKFTGGILKLIGAEDFCTNPTSSEQYKSIPICGVSRSVWSHIFGVSGDHLSAAAVNQVGYNMPVNDWVKLNFETIALETHSVDGGRLEVLQDGGLGGTISLPYGEWKVEASVLAHRTGAGGTSGVVLSIHGYDEDLGAEIPYSFRQGVQPVFGNDPLTLSTSFSVLNDEPSEYSGVRLVSIRVHSDTNKCYLGAEAGKVPAGSQNSAGFLTLTRIG